MFKNSYFNYDNRNIFVIDDFLPDYDYSQERYVEFLNFPNTYFENGGLGYDITPNDNNFNSQIFEYIEKYANEALKLVNLGELETIKTKVFIKGDITSPFMKAIHQDDTADLNNGYTLSYHCFGDNNAGGTIFYYDKQGLKPMLRIPHKANRLVIFPASIHHTGYAYPGFKNNSVRIIFTLFTYIKMLPIHLRTLNYTINKIPLNLKPKFE